MYLQLIACLCRLEIIMKNKGNQKHLTFLLPGFNSLATKYPDIAAMWSDKNQFSADQILPNTTMAFWTCPTCHGDYPARINKVINGKV